MVSCYLQAILETPADVTAHAILVGLISRNSNSVATRAVASPLYNMTYQFGSIAAVNIYRKDDAPFCKFKPNCLTLQSPLSLHSYDH